MVNPAVLRGVAPVIVLLLLAANLGVSADGPLPADPPVPVLASSLTLEWLAGAEVQPWTFLAPGLEEPVTVYAKAPLQFAEADGAPHVLMPCVPGMDARVDVALCDLSQEILRHPEAYLGDEWLPVIVEVPDVVPLADAAQALAAAGDVVSDVAALPLVHMLTAQAHMGRLDAWMREPLSGVVDFVWLDRLVQPALDDSVPQVGADDVWAMTDADGDPVVGRGTTVAILDTGVNYLHADFGGCTSARFDAGDCRVTRWGVFTGESCARPCDGHGHGTHVAATAAGNGTYKGVAPEAEVWAGKVLSNGGSGAWSGVIQGIEWAANNGADVISMSLGGGCSPCDGSDPVSQAVDAATALGTLVVVAAGNSGPAAPSVGTPAVAATALTVGAVDDLDALASFSSRGPTSDLRTKPEIVAPGVAICAAVAGQYAANCGPAHRALSGTSMATPHVSGAAALLVQLHPDWTPADLKSALALAADDTGLLAREQGAGRLDAARAAAVPLLVDHAVVDFGNLGAADTAVRQVTLTNPGASPITVTLTPGTARQVGGTGGHAVLRSSASSVSLAPGASQSIDLTLDLTGLGGSFEGAATLQVGTETYRLPYAGSHLALIRVQTLWNGQVRHHTALLADAAFDALVYRSSSAAASFWVTPGTYNVFAYNSPVDVPVFMVREQVTVAIGEERDVTIDLNTVPLHTFDAVDSQGRRLQVEHDSNAVLVKSGATEVLFASYQARGFRQNGHEVRLGGLDLAGTGFELLYVKDHSGAYVPECTTPYFARTTALRNRCYGAFETAEEYYLAGTLASNPSAADTSHRWEAADAIGPYVHSYDSGISGEPAAQGAALILPGSIASFMFLDETFQGSRRDLHYLDDDRWGLHATAWDFDRAFEHGTSFSFNPATDADDIAFFATPPQFAGLVTGGTRLASDRHTFFGTAQASFHARNGILRAEDEDGSQLPRLKVYRNGVLQRDQTLGWDDNVDSLFQTLSPGSTYQAKLTLPDLAWGVVTQTHNFAYGQQTPRIVRVDHAPRFTTDVPYEVAVTVADPTATVGIEFGQGGVWMPAATTQAGAVHSAQVVPASTAVLGLRVTVSKGGASTILEYASAAVPAVPLRFDLTKTATTVSGTCSNMLWGACPDVAVRLLCDGTDVRGGYFLNGFMDAVSLACAGTVTAVFEGSGPFSQYVPPPEIDITRPEGANLYLDDVEHARQVPDGVLPPALEPDLTANPHDDPWIVGNLTIRFTVDGPADWVRLYIQDQLKADLPVEADGAYEWFWSGDDQIDHHTAGNAPIRVEASYRGSVGMAVRDTLLLVAPPSDLRVPHFDGAGTWLRFVSGPQPMPTIDPINVQIDPSDPLVVDPAALIEYVKSIDPTIGPIQYNGGAMVLSTREDRGTIVRTDEWGRLDTVALRDVAWSYEGLPTYNALAWNVEVTMVSDEEEWLTMRGPWTPAFVSSQCNMSIPQTCWHYAVGPLTLTGDAPHWSNGIVEGLHGGIVCTVNATGVSPPRPCGGDVWPAQEIVDRLLRSIGQLLAS